MSETASNSIHPGPRNSVFGAKYTFYHDSSADSEAILQLVNSLVPAEHVQIVTGTLDKNEVKKIQYNLDPPDRPTLLKNSSLLTKDQIQRIKNDDFGILCQLLSGPEGASKLVYPILMCPNAGTIVVGNHPDRVKAMLKEGGWDKALTKANISVEVNFNKISLAPKAQIGRYKLYHEDFNSRSQALLEYLQPRLVGGQYSIHAQPLTENEALDLIKMIKPVTNVIQIVRKPQKAFTPEELASVEAGENLPLIASKLCGEGGQQFLLRPLFVDTHSSRILIAPSDADVAELLTEAGWKDPVSPLSAVSDISADSMSQKPSMTASIISFATMQKNQMHFMLFHDPNSAQSFEIFDLLRYSAAPESFTVLTAPLSQNDVKKLLHLLDPKEYLTLITDPKLLTKEEQELTIKGDMTPLSKKLSGPEGLKRLVRPILVSPVAGTIVVGYQLDEMSTIISSGGSFW